MVRKKEFRLKRFISLELFISLEEINLSRQNKIPLFCLINHGISLSNLLYIYLLFIFFFIFFVCKDKEMIN